MADKKGQEAEARMMKTIAESAGMPEEAARIEYEPAYKDRLKTIAGLVKEGYPPEIGAMVPLYWIAKKPNGYFVLGGAYGTECDPEKAMRCGSLEEAESENALYERLDLETVKALHPVQFTSEVRARLRRLNGSRRHILEFARARGSSESG